LNLRPRELSAEEFVSRMEERLRVWRGGQEWMRGRGQYLYANALRLATPEQLKRIVAARRAAARDEGARSARTARPQLTA
jgi:hypothetical protein